MKKMFVLVLLVPMLTIAFISCDADMRSNLAGFMGNFDGNVYIDNGLVEPDFSEVEAASDSVAAISGNVPTWSGDTLNDFGIPLDLSSATTSVDKTKPIIQPLSGDAKNSFTVKIEASLSSLNSDVFIDEMKTEATAEQQEAAEGTITVFNATLEVLASSITDSGLKSTIEQLSITPVSDSATLTQGDVLILQLMTNLVAETVNALKNDAGTAIDETKLTSDSALAIIDDALFAAQVAEQLSGISSIDFTGNLELETLFELNRGISRDTTNTLDSDAQKVVGAIRGILPALINTMGISKNGDDYSYTVFKYESFLRNQKIYRSTIEHALKVAEKKSISISNSTNAKVDTSTLLKYFIAVLVTEHHAYWEANAVSESQKPNAIIEAFLDANPGFGVKVERDTPAITSWTHPDSITFPYDETAMIAYKNTRTLEYFRDVVTNLQTINSAIPADKRFNDIDDALDEMLAEMDADWWTDL